MRILKKYINWAIVLAFLVQPPCFAHQLPDLGNEFRSALSIHDEKLMGDMLMQQIRAVGMLHPDFLIHEYVKHVGNRLTPYASMPYNMRFKFFAVDDNSINAFAFFGGHVAVHSGLIHVTENESELAGVMAHELAHISQQHVLRQISDSKRMMPLTIAGAIAAVAIGVPELILPALAGHQQSMLNYSRQYEQEADRVGMQILTKAHFDPQGMPNILDRMSVNLRYHNKPPEYLLTHPLFESRIADLRNRANSISYKQQTSSNMFHLIKARIIVQSSTNLDQLLQEYEHILDTQRYANKLAANYTYAYAQLQKGNPDQAWESFRPLAEAYPEDLIIQMTAADIEAQQHRLYQANQRMSQLQKVYPDSAAVLLQSADFLLRAKQPLKAANVLEKYKSVHSPEPMYYEYMRRVAGMQGNQTAVYEANAEWYVLHGDIHSALGQLKLASEVKTNDSKANKRIKLRQEDLTALLQSMKEV
jgi:predicted Zn-dependent protease